MRSRHEATQDPECPAPHDKETIAHYQTPPPSRPDDEPRRLPDPRSHGRPPPGARGQPAGVHDRMSRAVSKKSAMLSAGPSPTTATRSDRAAISLSWRSLSVASLSAAFVLAVGSVTLCSRTPRIFSIYI